MDQLNNRGLSNPGLKFGLWYTAHKILLRKIFVSVSIAAILLLYFFNIYSSFKIFVIQKNTDSEVLLSLMSDSSGIQSIQSRFRPQQIQITGVSVLPREKDLSDIVVHVENPNLAYYAKKALYRVMTGTKILSSGETYLWPNDKKFVVAYNVSEAGNSPDIAVQFYEVAWKRMDNYQKFQAEDVNFPILSPLYAPSRTSVNGKYIPASIKFTVSNQTIFNYWDVGINAILYNGSSVIGAAYTQIHEFKSLEKIPLDMKILYDVPSVTNMEIYPELNVLDEKVFMAPQDLVGEQK